jgi:ribose-phosphate pyrophosphokinase
MYDLKVFSCNCTRTFADEVCKHLGIPLGKSESFKFDNDNTFVKILEKVREDDVFIIQTSMPPVDANFMELLIMIDALKRSSAKKVSVVLPYYPYVRSDKKDQPRIAITARLVADLLNASGANRVLACDLHSTQIQGFFSIPMDQLTAEQILADYYAQKGFDDLVVVATDAGSSKKAYKYAKRLGVPMALLDKRRLGNDQEVEINKLIGDVNGKRAVVFDDEIDRASSLIEAANVILRHGAKEVYAGCTHAVLSGPAIERIKNSPIKEVVVTNTIPLTPEKNIDKITVLSMAPLFAEAIKRIHYGDSMGEMF